MPLTNDPVGGGKRFGHAPVRHQHGDESTTRFQRICNGVYEPGMVIRIDEVESAEVAEYQIHRGMLSTWISSNPNR
jgi:hypothetical protein